MESAAEAGSGLLGQYQRDLVPSKPVVLCSVGPLLCQPGWEVAQPPYPSTTPFRLRAMQERPSSTQASPAASLGRHSEMELGGQPVPLSWSPALWELGVL